MKLTELLEGKGNEVLLFNDYIARWAEKETKPINTPRFKKLGIALFKAGFTYDDAAFHKLPAEGGVYEFDFPGIRQLYEFEQGLVTCRCAFNLVENGKSVMYRFEKALSLNEIDLWTVPTLIDFMHKGARPVK